MAVDIFVQDEQVNVSATAEQVNSNVDQSVVIIKGADGKDGTSPVVSVSTITGGHRITITDTNGTKTVDVMDGVDGQDGSPGQNGQDGSDGVGIASIVQTTTSTEDGGNNVLTVTLTNGTKATLTVKNGNKGSTGATGAVGAAGRDGVDGYTPVKGVDYYTDDEKAEFEAIIADEMASRAQIKPEFANSIGECTDTGKLYVFPDGYIYAYMQGEATQETQIDGFESAVNTDGSPYNSGQGFKDDHRLNSSGVESEFGGMDVTGFIPIQAGDIITVTGAKPGGNTAYFHYYRDDFSWLASAASDKTDGESPNITLKVTNESAAYFRMTANLDNAAITITRTLVITDGYAWANTGHAFVPADYEDRILSAEETIVGLETSIDNLETDVEIHETRITNLESDTATMPDYVKTEAESVIDRVIAAQGSKTFTFAAITDLHYGNGNYTDGVKHACQAISYIDSRIGLDAIAVLGDMTDSMGTTSESETVADIRAVNALMNNTRFAPTLRVMGNHDFVATHSPTTARYINSFNKNVVWGDRLGGYFYVDFEEFNLRVITVNCNEVYYNSLECNDEQYNWFIDSLDLTAKDNAADWQILILSHMPLDWFAYNNRYIFWQILNAYISGGSYSTSTGGVTCNFANKNIAKIIGNIHGHIHNFLVRNITAGQPNTTEATIDVKRIATPEACYGRPNSYNGTWDYNPFGEATSYPKSQGTAEDTAFCIYCIDLDAHTVKAICYGAGYDREINY